VTEAIIKLQPGFVVRWFHRLNEWWERRHRTDFHFDRESMQRMVAAARLKASNWCEKTKEFASNHSAVITGLIAIVGLLGAAYAWHRKGLPLEPVAISKIDPLSLECFHDSETNPVFYQTTDGGIKIVAIDDGLKINGEDFAWTEYENCDVMICTKSMAAEIFVDMTGSEDVRKIISITNCQDCIPAEKPHSDFTFKETVSYESGVQKDNRSKNMVESGTAKQQILQKVLESGKTRQPMAVRSPESGAAKDKQSQVKMESDARVALESFHSHQSMEITRVVRQAYGFVLTDGDQYVCPILAIGGRAALTNIHYWNRVPDSFKYKLPYGRNTLIALRKSDVVAKPFERLPGQETDLVVLMFPRTVPVARDLMKSFVDKDQVSMLTGSQFVLLSPGLYVDKGVHQTFMHKTGVIDRVEVASRTVVEIGRKLIGLEIYSNNCRTEPGDCCGAYVLDDNRFRGKICAIHFAGQFSGGAVGVLITKQDLEAIKDVSFEGLPYDPTCEDLPMDGVIFHHKTAAPSLPITTSFEPTLVKGLIDDCGTEPTKLSAMLKDGGPGILGLKKVGGFVYRPEDVPFQKAVDSFNEIVFAGQPHEEYEKRVLTFEEAAGGIDGTPFVRGVNRSRSPGYPWVLEKGGNKGKRKWLGNDSWTFGSECQPLRDAVSDKIRKATDGVWKPSPYIDALKDETRPVGKKTRVFSMAAQELVISIRMYFLGFFSYLMRNRIDNELAVGIRSQSMDWHKLARKLKSKGPCVVAGDFTDYDGNLNPKFLWVICDMANMWYADGNEAIRRILWLDVVNSFHVAGDFMYQWTHSQPSGNPGTAIINSIANSLMCRYVYYSLAMGADKAPPFNKVVTMVSYGDDNVLNISDEVVEWFNQITMSYVFPTIGMTYTDANKETIQREYVSLEEASFLKRGFRMEDGLWLGPLEQRSINNRLEWQKRGSDMETLVENAKAAIAEWALHCDADFEFWSHKIQTVFMDQLNIAVPVHQKQEYIDLVRSGKIEEEYPFLCFA
jgi:hypothetical protein